MKIHYLENELLDLFGHDKTLFNFIKDVVFDGIWLWDLEKPENEWLSPSFWTTFGIDPQTMPHSPSAWQSLVFEDDFKEAQRLVGEHLKNPEKPYEQILRYRHTDRSVVWIHCKGMAIRNDQGIPIRLFGVHTKVSAIVLKEGEFSSLKQEMVGYMQLGGDNQEKADSFIQEVAERFTLRQEIEEKDRLLRVLAENSSDFLVIFDSNFEVIYVSPSFERITGKSLQDNSINSEEYFKMIREDYREKIKNMALEMFQKQVPYVKHQYPLIIGNEEKWMEDFATFKYDQFGKLESVYVVSRDCTKRKMLELELAKESQKRKEIAESLVEQKEKAKEEIYQDLHDGVNNLLYASKTHLEHVANQEDVHLKKALEHLHTAMEEIRQIAIESTSQFLDEGCFVSAIGEYLKKLEVRTTIRFVVENHITWAIPITTSRKKHLFRICQELAQNAMKYSKGDEMIFRFKIEDDSVVFIAKDNGVGIKTNFVYGLGLRSIRDRVYLMDGKVRFFNFVDKGFAVYIKVKFE